jgi:mannose-1-phosphate guanylyltransferase/phosphomannomutase
MKAVLMAGGSGTRLRPLTCDLPKPMVPIINKPIIWHIANLLKKHNFYDIIVTLHYLPDIIKNYLKDGSEIGVNISYSVEEGSPLGTAGCVKNIQNNLNDTFIVISGDSLTDFDLTKAIEFHRNKNSKATIILTRVSNPLEYGVVITNEEGKIERFLEKPTSSEVFSDTINTGIYILEPEVLNYLPSNVEKDFSKDLFPLLLKNNEPLYGYVSEGYWCDIGNLDTYRNANYDALNGKLKIKIPYKEIEKCIWIGEDVVIENSAKLEAPLVIGNNSYIGKNCKILSNSVIGDNVVISEETTLKRPILWNGVYIDKNCSLSGSIIGRNATIKRKTQILEGAVVGDDCKIGQEVIIKPEVRVWPSKNLESGSILKDSLIWGSGSQKSLFGEGGVKGIINLDISPEFAVQVGAAYGATIGIGKSISVSRDQSPVARLVSRALFSGILSVGVNIRNLEETPIPVTRYRIGALGVEGGIHVRSDSEDPEKVIIEFIDSNGINITPSQEKKIESTYYKQDYRKATIEEIGEINYPARVREKYIEGFLEYFKNSKLKKNIKVVIDYAYRISNIVLPTLLGKMGIDAVVLNAHVMSRPTDKEKTIKQLSEVVTAIKADFGVVIDSDGERLILLDEKGQVVSGNLLLALMTKLVMEENNGGIVVLPVDYPNIIDNIVNEYSGKTIMTKSSNRFLMEVAKKENAIFAGRNDGKFIFPRFSFGFDGMLATAKLSLLLSNKEESISNLIKKIPPINYLSDTLPCLTEQKGTIIRVLAEKTRGLKIDLLDGIKIYDKEGSWVLILPDSSESIIKLYADGNSKEVVENLIERYKEITEDIIKRHV